MKYFWLAALLALAACSGNRQGADNVNPSDDLSSRETEESRIEEEKTPGEETPAVPNPLVLSLSKTWFAKKITINGKENAEHFPTNDDELIFSENMTYTAIDKTYDDTMSGTWRLADDTTIVMKKQSSGETNSFGIVTLTQDSFVAKLLSFEDGEIKIHYSAVK